MPTQPTSDLLNPQTLLKTVQHMNDMAESDNALAAARRKEQAAVLRAQIVSCSEILQKLRFDRLSEEYQTAAEQKLQFESQLADLEASMDPEQEMARLDRLITRGKAEFTEAKMSETLSRKDAVHAIARTLAGKRPIVSHPHKFTTTRYAHDPSCRKVCAGGFLRADAALIPVKPIDPPISRKSRSVMQPVGLGGTLPAEQPKPAGLPWHDARAHETFLAKSAKAAPLNKFDFTGKSGSTARSSRSKSETPAHKMLTTSRSYNASTSSYILGTDIQLTKEQYDALTPEERSKPLHPAHFLDASAKHPRPWRRQPPNSTHTYFSVPDRGLPPSEEERRKMQIAGDADRAHYHPRREGKSEWKVTKPAAYRVFSHPPNDATWWQSESQKRMGELEQKFLKMTEDADDEYAPEDGEEVYDEEYER